MARGALTKTTAPGGYAGSWTAVTMNSGNATDGHYFALTGRELLVMTNTSTDTNYWVTLTSVDDPYGRSESITQVDIAFGATVVFGPIPLIGWQQTNGQFYVDVENAAIKIGVITLP